MDHKALPGILPGTNVNKCSNKNSRVKTCSTYVNSLAKKGYKNWLKPVHDFVRSSLCACISMRNKARKEEKLNVCDKLNKIECDDDSVINVEASNVDVVNDCRKELSSDVDDRNNDSCSNVDVWNNDVVDVDDFGKLNLLKLREQFTTTEVNQLRKDLSHLSQISSTLDIGSVPYVAVEMFNKSHYFCIDSGAAVSVLGKEMLRYIDPKQLEHFAFALNTANRSSVKVYGKLNLRFSIGDLCFVHDFVFAEVDKNFLGADFLRKYSIWLNVNHGIHVNEKPSMELSLTEHQGDLMLSNFVCSQDREVLDKTLESPIVNVDVDVPEFDALVEQFTQLKSTEFVELNNVVNNVDNNVMNDLNIDVNNDNNANNVLNNVDSIEPNDEITAADQHLLRRDVYSKDLCNDYCIDNDVSVQTLQYLRNKYPTVFSGELSLKVKHDITMHI